MIISGSADICQLDGSMAGGIERECDDERDCDEDSTQRRGDAEIRSKQQDDSTQSRKEHSKKLGQALS
jgi:hypothetical protein